MVEDLGNVGIQLSEVTGTMVEDLGNVGIQLSEVTGTNGRIFRKRPYTTVCSNRHKW